MHGFLPQRPPWLQRRIGCNFPWRFCIILHHLTSRQMCCIVLPCTGAMEVPPVPPFSRQSVHDLVIHDFRPAVTDAAISAYAISPSASCQPFALHQARKLGSYTPYRPPGLTWSDTDQWTLRSLASSWGDQSYRFDMIQYHICASSEVLVHVDPDGSPHSP